MEEYQNPHTNLYETDNNNLRNDDLQKSCEVYTPSSVFITLANTYSLPETFKSHIVIKGLYLKNVSNFGQNYDVLKDLINDVSLKVVLPQNLKTLLHDNTIYTFKGVLSHKMYKGNIYFSLIVTESPIQHSDTNSRLDKINELLSLKASQSSIQKPSDVIRKNLMESKRTRLLCLFPNDPLTKTEFYNKISDLSSTYETIETQTNFCDKDSFCRKLEGLDTIGYDVIVILRGGITGIDMFNDLDIAKNILEMKTPVLLGVGHQDTNVILRSFVPEWRANPTETGMLLRDLALNWSEKKDLKEENTRLKNQLKEKDTTINTTQNIVRERDRTITEKEKTITAKETALVERLKSMESFQKQIKRQHDEIIRKEELLTKFDFKCKLFPYILIFNVCLIIIIIIILCQI